MYYLSRAPRHTILGGLRATARILWFGMSFTAMALISVAARALLPAPIHRRCAQSLRRWQGRRLTGAAGVRVVRRGRPPRSGMVVANHLSWLDSFLMLAETGARFVANYVWGALPVLRTVLRASGVIFIERTRLRDTRVVGNTIARFLACGQNVLVYPEATTTHGDALLPFRGALLQPAAQLGLPVSWAALRYETPPGWPPASVVVAWADWSSLLSHMYRTFHVPWVRAEITYGARPVTAPTRKMLAEQLQTAVERAFVPLQQLTPQELKRVSVPTPGPQPKY